MSECAMEVWPIDTLLLSWRYLSWKNCPPLLLANYIRPILSTWDTCLWATVRWKRGAFQNNCFPILQLQFRVSVRGVFKRSVHWSSCWDMPSQDTGISCRRCKEV